jgi:hypothetical protein
MRVFYKLTLLFLMLMGGGSVQAQVSKFKSVSYADGVVTPNSNGLYVWGQQKSGTVYLTFDIPGKQIIQENPVTKTKVKFEIFDKPQKWVVRKNYKYLNFECMESETMEKYYVRLCEYDSGTFKVTVMSPKNAVRYQVVYMKDGVEPEHVIDSYDEAED